MGGKGHGAHLEDQAERARIKADPPLSPLIRIICSSLSTLARFTGLSAQPHTHTLCPSRQTWPPFISKTPSLSHRGLSSEDAHWDLCCMKWKVPGKADVENRLVGGWSHATRILQHQTATVAFYTPFPAPSHFSSTYCGHTTPLISETGKLHQLKDPTRYLAQAFLQFICQPNHLYHETPHKRALQTETNQR